MATIRWTGLVVVALLASCGGEREHAVRDGIASPEEAARELLSIRYDVPAESLSFDAVTASNYAHRSDNPSMIKWRDASGREGVIALDGDGQELEIAVLDEAEVSFIHEHGLKLAPSLKAAFEVVGGESLPVAVTFIPEAGMDFSSWDENSSVQDVALLEARQIGVSALSAETEARAAWLANTWDTTVLSLAINSATVKLTRQQALAVAQVAFISELSLAADEASPRMIPLGANEGTSTGIYSFSNSYDAFGTGIGVLVHETGVPYDGSPGFSQGELAPFVHESGASAPAFTHARDVYANLAYKRAGYAGMSPKADFGVLSGGIGLKFTSDLSRLSALLASHSLSVGPYWVYNGSYAMNRSSADAAQVLGGYSATFDAFAWSAGFTSVFANGNVGKDYYPPETNGDDGDSSRSASPGNGFNSISVGGTNNSGTPDDASDDTVDVGSARIAPPSSHGDRVKPDILAPFVACVWAPCQPGTSFSAPLVTGQVANLMQVLPIAKVRPDVVKALLIANARPVVGAQVGAGFGQLSGVTLAGAMPWGSTRGLFMARTASCSALRAATSVVDLSSSNAFPMRVAMTWLSNGSSGAPRNAPFHDLDLVVEDSNGVVIARSARFDSTVEVVDFTPTPGAQYRVRISARRCTTGAVPFTVAWRSSGATLTSAPSTLGAATP